MCFPQTLISEISFLRGFFNLIICLHCSGGRLVTFGKLFLQSCDLESWRCKSREGGKVESLEAKCKRSYN